MMVRITERVGKKINVDRRGWYQTKVNEIAHFFVQRIKEDVVAVEKIESNKYEELEVLTNESSLICSCVE